MVTLQEQARALGDPTRHAVFAYVADAPGPVGVAELTEHVGLNHNAVRQHLAKLVAADLLVETHAPPHGRGRPPLRYEVHPAADGRWTDDGPYERLAAWLAEAVRTGDAPIEVGRREGRRRLATGPDGGDEGDRVGRLTREMGRLGFEPEVTDGDDGARTIILAHCPFAATARLDPGTVCGLHLGMAEGLAEAIGGLEVHGLELADPDAAGCRLQVRDQGP